MIEFCGHAGHEGLFDEGWIGHALDGWHKLNGDRKRLPLVTWKTLVAMAAALDGNVRRDDSTSFEDWFAAAEAAVKRLAVAADAVPIWRMDDAVQRTRRDGSRKTAEPQPAEAKRTGRATASAFDLSFLQTGLVRIVFMTGTLPCDVLNACVRGRAVDATALFESAVNAVRACLGASVIKRPLGRRNARVVIAFSPEGVASLLIGLAHPSCNTAAHYYAALAVRVLLLGGGVGDGLVSCEESRARTLFLSGNFLCNPFPKGNGGGVALASSPEAKERARASQIKKGASSILGFGKCLSEEALRNCRVRELSKVGGDILQKAEAEAQESGKSFDDVVDEVLLERATASAAAAKAKADEPFDALVFKDDYKRKMDAAVSEVRERVAMSKEEAAVREAARLKKKEASKARRRDEAAVNRAAGYVSEARANSASAATAADDVGREMTAAIVFHKAALAVTSEKDEDAKPQKRLDRDDAEAVARAAHAVVAVAKDGTVAGAMRDALVESARRARDAADAVVAESFEAAKIAKRAAREAAFVAPKKRVRDAKKAEAAAEKTLPKRPKVREPIAAPKDRTTLDLPKKMFDGDTAKEALAGWRNAPIDAAAAALSVLKKTQDGEPLDLTCWAHFKLAKSETEETFLVHRRLGSVDGEDDRVHCNFQGFKHTSTILFLFLDENGFGVMRRTSNAHSQRAVCYSLVRCVEAPGGTKDDLVELVGEHVLVHAAQRGTKPSKPPIAAPKKRTMHLPKKTFDGDPKEALAGWRNAPIDAATAALSVLKKTQDGERSDLTCWAHLKLAKSETEETFLVNKESGSVDGEDDRVRVRFNNYNHSTTLFFLDENGFGVVRRTAQKHSQRAVCYSLVRRVEAPGGTKDDLVELVGEHVLVHAAAIGTKKRKAAPASESRKEPRKHKRPRPKNAAPTPVARSPEASARDQGVAEARKRVDDWSNYAIARSRAGADGPALVRDEARGSVRRVPVPDGWSSEVFDAFVEAFASTIHEAAVQAVDADRAQGQVDALP